ncbi:TPA: hypothetical protein ACGO1T_001243 [Streptococcus suis]
MRKGILPIGLLTALIVLSMALSYLLIFDNNVLLSRWMNNSQAQVNIQNDSTSQTTEYYALARVRLADVVYPTRLTVSTNNQAYLVYDYQTLVDLATLLSQTRATLTGKVIEPTEEAYLDLISQERVELEFSTLHPFELADHFIKDESDQTEFLFNRIIFPNKDQGGKVYLVNSVAHVYMEAKLPSGSLSSAYFDRISQVRDQWVKATRYSLQNGSYVYIPDDGLTVQSQVYTLNRVPETNIIQALFGNSRSWRYDSSDQSQGNQTVTYYNANLEAAINLSSQIVTVNYKNTNLSEAKTFAQRIEQSFNQIRQFEYWNQGLRYGSQSNATTSVYQRYLQGRPIFPAANLGQYASGRVIFRGGNLTSSITRVVMPMLYLEAHIPDLSRDYQLPNVDEILYELNIAGFDVTDFTNVVLGYEWQSDMADYQKVTFIPRWYFEYNGSHYTLEQIMDGAIKPQTQTSQVPSNQGGGDSNGL